MDEEKTTGYWFNLELFIGGKNLQEAEQQLEKLLADMGVTFRMKNRKSNHSSRPSEVGRFSSLAVMINKFKEQGTLLRLHIIKNKGVKFSIPCRILNFDEKAEMLSVYHVDEKKVYSFKLNEIEDVDAYG